VQTVLDLILGQNPLMLLLFGLSVITVAVIFCSSVQTYTAGNLRKRRIQKKARYRTAKDEKPQALYQRTPSHVFAASG